MDSDVCTLLKKSPSYTDHLFDAAIVVASGLILLVTLYCLIVGITTVFMHLYYFPVILLAYRYKVKGVFYATLLSLLYLGMVVYFQYSEAIELFSALLRVFSFIGVAIVIAWLSIHLERKQQELSVISRFNESIVSNANVWLAVLDSEGKIIVWNKAAEDISGYTADEVIGNNIIWKQLYPDRNNRKKITGTITQIISQNKFFENFETTIQAKNGEQKLISWNTRTIADDPGAQTRYVVIGIDITARKRAEEALSASELRFRRSFETAKDGLLLIEKDSWKILKVNPALTEILDNSANEITGKNFRDIGLINSADFQNLKQKLADYGFAFFADVPIDTKVGKHLDAEMYLVDRTMQVQCNVRDISGRKQAEREIIQKNEELSRSQQALSQALRKLNLLNSITFEDIRNAVFSLNGYLELQKTRTLDETITGYIEKEKVIVQKIEKTLDFTKNYQHMGINPPEWQNVTQVFLFAISHLPPLNVTRNINLDHLEVYADPLLEKVLFNITENMIRHSVSATEFSLYYRETSSGLRLFIEDNGIGIPASEKENIFSRGYGEKRGMGLFIAREILEITGIGIKETGEPGNGARFEIFIPKDKYRFSGNA